VRQIQSDMDRLTRQVNAATASAAESAKAAHRVRAARRYHERKGGPTHTTTVPGAVPDRSDGGLRLAGLSDTHQAPELLDQS
jgi:hypothetical protein